MFAQLTVPGSEILPGDVLKRYPSSPVAMAEDVDPSYPNSRTLRMANGTWYFCSPVQEYVVLREVDERAPAYGPVLALGPIDTPDQIDSLRGHAFDVADQMGVPATYATHVDYTVTDYVAVYLTGTVTELRDAPTLVLLGEALAAGMEVHEPQAPQDAAVCVCGQAQTVRTVVDERGDVWCAECRGETGCAWCGEWPDMEDVEIIERGDTFYPAHVVCLDGMRRASSADTLPSV